MVKSFSIDCLLPGRSDEFTINTERKDRKIADSDIYDYHLSGNGLCGCLHIKHAYILKKFYDHLYQLDK